MIIIHDASLKNCTLLSTSNLIKEVISCHNHDNRTLTEKYDRTITHFPNKAIFTLSFILSATYLRYLSRNNLALQQIIRHYDFSHRLHRVKLRCFCLTRQIYVLWNSTSQFRFSLVDTRENINDSIETSILRLTSQTLYYENM